MRRFSHLFEPVDNSSLVFLRIALGVCFAFHIGEHALGDSKYLDIAAPSLPLRYPGLGWIPSIPEDVMRLLLDAMLVASFGIALGLAYRLSCFVYAFGAGYLHFTDPALFLNHYYLVFLLALLLNFVPAHGSFSIDALIRPSGRRTTTPRWTIWLLRFQVGIPFLFSGLSKLNGDWIEGLPTLYHWQSFVSEHPGAAALPTIAMARLIAWAGLFTDITVFPLMLWRRTRPFGFALAVIFNLGNAVLFSGPSFNVAMFPWIMLGGVTIFLDPDWPRRLIARLRRRPFEAASDGPPDTAPGGALPSGSAITLALLGLYVLVQLALPIRSYLYPGDNRWTEAARTHSWRMMEMIKVAETSYRVTDPATGESWTRHPLGPISGRRYRRLQSSPALIHQYALHIKKQMAEQGHPGVEVRVDSFAILNGRPAQRQIDPTVDITTAPSFLGYYPWVLPLEEPRPSLPERVALFRAMGGQAPTGDTEDE